MRTGLAVIIILSFLAYFLMDSNPENLENNHKANASAVEPVEKIPVELVPFQEGTELFLAEIENNDSNSPQRVRTDLNWNSYEFGMTDISNGGVYYKLVLSDGTKKFGLLSVTKNTKKIVLR